MRADRDITFLVRRRYPAYTARWHEVVNRIAQVRQDPDLSKDETLDEVGAELYEDLTEVFAESDNNSRIVRDVSGQLSPDARSWLRDYLNGYRDFIGQLHEMENAEYARLLGQEELRLQEEENAAATKRDEAEFFNFPTSAADLTRWLKVPSWHPDEAVALSLGKEPTVVNWKTLNSPAFLRGAFRKEYGRRLELVRRALGVRGLLEPITPSSFIDWAQKAGWETDLAATHQCNQSPSSAQSTTPAPADDIVQDDRVQRDGDSDALKAEIRRLKKENASSRSASTKEKNKLLQLLFVTIHAAYGYNPKKPDEKIVQQIHDDAESLGIGIDHGTKMNGPPVAVVDYIRGLRPAKTNWTPPKTSRTGMSVGANPLK